VLRGFNAMSANRAAPSDGYINTPYSRDMGQEVFRANTVFSYFPQDYYAPPASAGLLGPGVRDHGRVDLAQAGELRQHDRVLVHPGLVRDELLQRAPTARRSTWSSCSSSPRLPPTSSTGSTGLMMHGTMSDEMRASDRGRGQRGLGLQLAPARKAGALSGRDRVAVPGAEVTPWSHNRRDFLVRTTCAALSAAAFQGTVRQFGLANLLATQNSITPNYARSSACS
jgi:hypothetical protein